MEGQKGLSAQEMEFEVQFDRKSQLDAMRPYVVRGEMLFAVYDLKGEATGPVALTDKRLLLLDKAFAGKKKAVVSIPWSRVSSLASDASGGSPFGTATLYVTTLGGRTFELQFISGEKARRAYSTIMEQLLQGEIAG